MASFLLTLVTTILIQIAWPRNLFGLSHYKAITGGRREAQKFRDLRHKKATVATFKYFDETALDREQWGSFRQGISLRARVSDVVCSFGSTLE
jgi:hypothetical protein